MRGLFKIGASAALLTSLAMSALSVPAGAQSNRVQISGELVDTFCTVSEIMFASGTAHYQCAVWCAVGGVPVSMRAENGELYMILRIEEDDTSAANPKLVRIQGHEAMVDGELIRRDGVNYILVTTVADDKGVVKLTHEEHGIQPFGN
jgi:anaerobic selenocysteine-containing dehydrogenase